MEQCVSKAKSLIGRAKDKDDRGVKKDDYFKVLYSELNIERGHNMRDVHSDAAKEHIHKMFLSIQAGAELPCLDVRFGGDGKIYVVDGECRYHAYGMAIAAGVAIEYIKCMEDRGNDAHRVVKMLTRNQGLNLTPLEAGLGYAKLERQFSWSDAEIASHIGSSVDHVKQLLLLAHANTDVHNYVRSGVVSSHYAIELVRVHGENTGAFIAAGLDKVAQRGGNKLTKAAVSGRALPKKIVHSVVSSVKTFTASLDRGSREALAALEMQPPEALQGKKIEVDASALLALLQANATMAEAEAKQADKIRQKEEAAKQADII